ncbi:hypothetical protein B296_00001729 [Ensete ventricosum]|uniref:Uncharacterized protein n=1 Tax=Ensete ventricosum TaxID=4639 RepID=A0A427ANF0_ENSVE|nr:hypothetical protein B296_00001729 [Ensete ventricosum]
MILCGTNATSSDPSLPSVYIAAHSNISLPIALIATNNELNMTSSDLSLHTTAALLCNNRALHCPIFPLLPTADITIVVFFLHITATLGCHPLSTQQPLGDLTTAALTILQHHRNRTFSSFCYHYCLQPED